MNRDLSPQERFAQLEQAFSYCQSSAAPSQLDRLRAAEAGLPTLPSEPETLALDALRALLGEREAYLGRALAAFLRDSVATLAVEALQAEHAFRVLFAYTRLLDALHGVAFRTASAELPLLLQVRRLETAQGLESRRQAVNRRLDGVAALEAEAGRPESEDDDPGHRAYLQRVADEQRAELEALQAAVREHELAGPALAAFVPDSEALAGRIVMFARGGYGRAEMSFSSDVDTGYCLDERGLAPAQVRVYHDFVLRVERLLQGMELETAHQFFELDEDLSRFAEPEALHTIPSILESRALEGNPAVLAELQAQFRAMLPLEQLVRGKLAEFEEQPVPRFTSMDLKGDFGGLRSIQTPLWLLGILSVASGFMTLDLLRLARARGMLSAWEEARLLLALEFLYELRNFVGAAEQHYYDREARESGFFVQGFRANRLDDQVARLYLFRKQRFDSIDAFDTYRLRRVEDVQRISRRLLERVLDRTLIHELGDFRVSVHLGHKQIIAVEGAAPDTPVDVRALLGSAGALLTLFAYISVSGYDLTAELKDALSDVVGAIRPAQAGPERERQAALLGELMGAPHAHRAVETLFEISDPLAEGTPSLLGRFIPAFDGTVFLLRRFEGQTLPLHTQILRSLAWGEAELTTLRRQHPELYRLLGSTDVLALKWSLLLQGLGRLAGGPLGPAQTAEQAAGVLAQLGCDDPQLEGSVRLLIEHHATVAGLARTSTYMDQALARYFEIAGRSLVNVTLLYVVNLAVLQAHGEQAAADVAALRHLFNEANAILGEMQGFPVQERSLEVINLYFDRKKQELVADTRLHLLLQNAIARGLGPAVFEPLRRSEHPSWERVQRASTELVALQREIKLGAVSTREEGRLQERLLQGLRHQLGRDAVLTLTAEHDEVLSWFFAGFANRFLLGSLPGELAAQLAKFAHFRQAQVIVDVVAGAGGASEGLLIYLRGLTRPHTRVAYAMSRNRVNIASGKVNPVDLGGGERAFCYYFQISTLDPQARLVARDLELMIATESPPELAFPRRSAQYERSKARVEFRGDDGKGYLVAKGDGRFVRKPAAFRHLRVVLRDEPYLFYKVSRAFDLFDVEVQQSLITTIGNQVMDYFYLDAEDYERLQASTFEEVLISLVNSDLLAVAR